MDSHPIGTGTADGSSSGNSNSNSASASTTAQSSSGSNNSSSSGQSANTAGTASSSAASNSSADRSSVAESVASTRTVDTKSSSSEKSDDVAGEIIKSLFGDVGELISDFSCAIESNILLHGRMYITSRFVCFYSNLFGLEKKIRIPYQHIKLITKENTAVVIPNAIAITTHQKEYIFRSFWDRDECYGIITNMLAKSRNAPKADRDKEKDKFDTERLSVIVGSESISGPSGQQASRPLSVPVTQSSKPPSAIASPTASADTSSLTTASSVSVANDKSRRKSIAISSNLASSTSSMVALTPVPNAAENESDLVMGRKELDSADNTEATAAQASIDKSTLIKELNAEIESSKLKIPVASEKFNISVDMFEKLFVSEDCPEGYIVYHKMMKDENIEVTPWSSQSTSLGHAREIRFLKPVNLPGLASTRAKKLQRFRRFGDEGLIVCSSTHLEDVPAADTFSVEDMIAVVAAGPNEIQVSLTFEVKFVKSTMFRRLIESSTNTEMNKWLVDFFAYLKKCSESSTTIASKPKPTDNVPAKKKGDNKPKEKSGAALHVKPPEAVVHPTSLVDQIRHEFLSIDFAHYKVFWIAWFALMMALFFFGMQWKSVSDQMYYSNIEIKKIMDLCQKVTEENSRLVALLEKSKGVV